MPRSAVEGLLVEHTHAQVERLAIVTADPLFDAYDVPVIRAT